MNEGTDMEDKGKEKGSGAKGVKQKKRVGVK